MRALRHGEFGVSKSMECDIFPFGDMKGIRPVKTQDVGSLVVMI